MPTYRVTDSKTGKSYKLTGDSPPTEAELTQIFGAAPAVPVAPEGPGVLSTIANNFKSPVRSALELAGRPAEALQGLVAGTLQGGVGEGLRRGFAAATEADLVNSKIEESTSKTLLENNILADSPKMRAALGLVGDIVTDPTNLLGGAGFIRRGAMTGAKALGAGEKTARTIVGLPIADAFANKVIAPTGKAITQGVAKFGPEALAQNAKLKLRVDPVTGLNANEMRRLAEGKNRAIKESIVKDILSGDDAMFKGIEMADRKMISYATEYPKSKQALDVAADPVLAAVQVKFADKFGDLYKSDVKNKLMDETANIGLTPALQQKLDTLDSAKLAKLERIIKNSTSPFKTVKGVPVADTELEALASAITKATQRTEDGVTTATHDIGSLKFTKDAEGTITPSVSSQRLNYTSHYVPGQEQPASIFRNVNPRLNEAKNQKTTLKEAVAQGAPDDAADILIRRAQNSARATIDKQLITDYATAFGKAEMAPGYKALRASTLDMLPPGLVETIKKTPYLPAEVVADLERYSFRMNDTKKVMGAVVQGTKLFRAVATSLNAPVYQVNNFVGNITNMYGSGMSIDEIVKEYWNAAGRINSKTPRPLKPFKGAGANGRAWTDAEVMQAAKENGIYGHVSGYAGELGDKGDYTTASKLMTGKYNPLNPDNPLYTAVMNKSQAAIEDPAKLGMFIHRLKQGDSVERATLTVKNTLFDYAELSDKERYVKLVVPFYTWTRKNLPLQLANLAKNPKSIANQGRLLDFARELAASDDAPDVNESKLPDYMQEGNSFPIPFAKSNKGKAIVGSLKSPMMDLNLLSTDTPKVAEKLLGMVSPVKTLWEMYQNRDLETGREVNAGRIVDANLLSRLVGLGKEKADGTRVQPDWQRHLTDAAPLPFGSLLRSMPYQGDKTDMPTRDELLLRVLGLAPQAITSEMLQQTQKQNKAAATRARNAMKNRRAYDNLGQ